MASSTGTLNKIIKKKRTQISLEVKSKIIETLEKGEKAYRVARLYNLNESTIRTIRKNADAIKMAVKATIPSDSKMVKYARNTVMVKMEKLLIQWIEDNSKKHFGLDTRSIQTKALSIFTQLKKENGVGDEEVSLSFVASNGWFDKFKKRYNLQNIVGDAAANVDTEVTTEFVKYFKIFIENNGYSARQVFNASDTALFWKRMPSCTCLENAAQGLECAEDRLTLLFCANASGDYKCKPVLIHNTETSIQKSQSIPVHWKTNNKSRMTACLFEDWFTNIFCEEVKEYCLDQSIPFKILLLVDNAPSHPVNLDQLNPNVKVMFMAPNTTALVQPMDQGVIVTFKKYYLKYMFKQMLARAADKQMHDYSITDAMRNISKAWTDLDSTTMNVVWKNLWPDCVANLTDDSSLVKTVDRDVIEIVAFGRQLQGFSELKVSDIEELLKSYDVELTTNDLIELNQEYKKEQEEGQKKEEERQQVKEEEERQQDKEEKEERQQKKEERQQENGVKETPYLFTTENIQQSIAIIEKAMDFIESIDPDNERSRSICTGLKAQIAPYEHILEERRRTDEEHFTDEEFFTPSTSTNVTVEYSSSENEFE